MPFFLNRREVEAIDYWGRTGYEAAIFDVEVGEEPRDERILPHLSYFEYLNDLNSITWDEEDRHMFFRLRSMLLQSYAIGYRHFIDRNRGNI